MNPLAFLLRPFDASAWMLPPFALCIFGGSKSTSNNTQNTTVSNNQTSVDGSANGAGAQSVTASQSGKVTLDQRSGYMEMNGAKNSAFGDGAISANLGGRDNTLVQDSRNQMTVGGGGLTLGAGAVLSTDHGALDVAKDIALASLDGTASYVKDMRHFVESNQGLARSIAEGAFAVAADAPPPDTTRRALWIGGALVALALLLSAVVGLGRKKPKQPKSK